MKNCSDPMPSCWQSALSETRRARTGILVRAEPGYTISTTFDGRECVGRDQVILDRAFHEGHPRSLRLSQQDEFQLPLETGWRTWASDFSEDLIGGQLDALVIVDTDQFRNAIARVVRSRGYRMGFVHGRQVVRWLEFVHPVHLRLQIALMVFEARRMGEQAEVFADYLAGRFDTYLYLARKLAEAFPRFRVLVQDEYIVVQRSRGEKGVAQSYWSLPHGEVDLTSALATWLAKTSRLLALLPLQGVREGTPDFALELGDRPHPSASASCRHPCGETEKANHASG